MEAFVVQYHVPTQDSNGTWHNDAVFVGRDPVEAQFLAEAYLKQQQAANASRAPMDHRLYRIDQCRGTSC